MHCALPHSKGSLSVSVNVTSNFLYGLWMASLLGLFNDSRTGIAQSV
jgi:hypothetical protein